MSELQSENTKLKKTVNSLLSRIEDNDRIDRHFEGFEFKLLNSSRLIEVLDLLMVEALSYFGLEDVGLILVDSDYSVHDLLQHLEQESYQNRLRLRHNDDFALSLYSSRRARYEITLGRMDPLTRRQLFPNSSAIASVALLPLIRNKKLIGSLHFGSASPERFTADKAVDFMRHLASICAVCLDNSLAHEHLRRQSRIDMLTQVSNRMNFEMEFAKELERSGRSDDPLSCLFVDVDHFKAINDNFGHQNGDICLKAVAAAIKPQLRKTDLLARYGGEEFVVVLHRCETAEAVFIAERIREAVAALKIPADGQKKISPTVSIGLSCWLPAVEGNKNLQKLGQKLLKCADEAMYEAKHSGRNRVIMRPFVQSNNLISG